MGLKRIVGRSMSDQPIRVALVVGEPTPYRIPHLRVLAARPELDLTIFYAAETVQRRTWKVEHAEAVYLSGPKLPLARVLHHDYAITPGIWRRLERGRFDLVVVGGWSLMATQLAILWCRIHRVPYFLMSDNHLLEPRPAWVRALKRVVLPRLVPQAAAWLVPGSLARDHIASYGARPERTSVFPLTVDVEALAARADTLRVDRPNLRDELGIPQEAVAVLQVGRLIAMKAPADLVHAVGQARSATGLPLTLVLVGDGPEAPFLRQLAESLGVPLVLTGVLDGDELTAAYVAADIFALASRRETWGVVVNEAMACELPLVLSNQVGAAGDLLEPGGNGELFPCGDIGALAGALGRLAADPGRRDEYGRRSRELIRPWGYDASVEELVRLAREGTRR
jgi:glycosyltransferase involved in cell wall biosynthesis